MPNRSGGSQPPQGCKPSAEAMAQVQQYVAAGDRINAMKVYMQAAGVGLADAKRFVDQLMAQLKQS